MAQTPTQQVSYGDQFIKEHYVLNKSYNPYSCVSYAKWRMGISQSVYWGNASQIVPNAQNATADELVLLNEGNGHVAYIEALRGDYMLISEANYIAGKVSTRSLDIHNSDIRGYWH